MKNEYLFRLSKSDEEAKNIADEGEDLVIPLIQNGLVTMSLQSVSHLINEKHRAKNHNYLNFSSKFSSNISRIKNFKQSISFYLVFSDPLFQCFIKPS